VSKKKNAKPTSAPKIAANKANAKKSTGPTSPDGKARSAQNALKHGLLASQAIIPDDPDEDRGDFEALLEVITAEYRPLGPTQCLAVERIAICYWRLRRALRYEAHCVYRDRAKGRGVTPHDDLIYTAFDAVGSRGVIPVGQDFDRLVRYETMIDRQLNKLMDGFNQRRQTQPSAPQPTQPPDPPYAQDHPFTSATVRERSLDTPANDPDADPPYISATTRAALRALESLGLYDDLPEDSAPPASDDTPDDDDDDDEDDDDDGIGDDEDDEDEDDDADDDADDPTETLSLSKDAAPAPNE